MTVLDCADASHARRKVYLSPRDAILIPAVSCPANTTTVMKIYYGEFCAVWRNDSQFNRFGCYWDNVNQARSTTHGILIAPLLGSV